MSISLKRYTAGVAATAALAFGGVSTAQAAGPVFTGGLVNITVTDVANNNQVSVQVPIGVAANVCDVDVAILAETAEQGGTTTCTSATTQDLPVRFRP